MFASIKLVSTKDADRLSRGAVGYIQIVDKNELGDRYVMPTLIVKDVEVRSHQISN